MKLALPIVQAPMAGGPSTPALAAAVSEAGGLGFLGAGYKTVETVRDDLLAVRALTDRPVGLNLFAPPAPVPDRAAVQAYAEALGPGAGTPRHDDDGLADKLAMATEYRVPVVSFAFGCPAAEVLARLPAETWVTVTTVQEARLAQAAGADALVVQGVEAGGHRGSFDDTAPGDIGLLALLQLVRAAVGLPLIATGGIANGRGVAAVLAAGAEAAALGTAFMRCPEAATTEAHRARLGTDAPTALTRAFTGRTARGIVNRFMEDHPGAPLGYPDVHHATAPLRAAARARGDADAFNLWAGQAHALAEAIPAGDLVRKLAAEARAALADASGRLGAG